MKYELFDFQNDAANALLNKMQAMRNSYDTDGSLSAVSLTAPTGAGKTVISAAVAEGLFYGNDFFPGDDQAVILWLSDSPSLNEQTMKRFDAATDLLNGATVMETVGPEFAKAHSRLLPGHIYFLNRQLLSSKAKLTNEAEGGRTFYDVLTNTIEDVDTHLYLFIDEAHKGLGKDATKDSLNKTIYAKLIDGQENINPPMPCVVGISATPERFNAAMNGRKNRDMKAPVNVPVSAVRNSGLIKDVIELRTPKKAADTRHQDLTQACVKLSRASNLWKNYCISHGIQNVIPLMVVQVEDKVTNDSLAELCSQILKVCKWLDPGCFANVFGEHEDIKTTVANIPYCPPEDVAANTDIRVLFAKDAVSTGWDCPRAEVIYSRRKRNDPTYIAQLIGRMIRTPLARRIESVEELNTVACYLPEYDSQTVESIVEKLKEDNIPVDENGGIIKNPADVGWFGGVRKRREEELANSQKRETEDTTTGQLGTSNAETAVDNPITVEGSSDSGTKPIESKGDSSGIPLVSEDTINPYGNGLGEFEVDTGDDGADDVKKVLERIPNVDDTLIKQSFESIVTRQVRHDKPNAFLDLWDCVDVITSDIDRDSDLNDKITEEFCNNIEAEIVKHQPEFKRSHNDICNTMVTVKRIDPLTGNEYEDHEELVENDANRMLVYYKQAVAKFAGASDIVKAYINGYKNKKSVSDEKALARICAVAACFEIVQGLETWAENKTRDLLDAYGPSRYAVSEENKDKWNRIEGNTLPYVDNKLSINASVTRQNREYDRYLKHIICDDDGWAYLKLNDLEKKVVETELSRPMNVAWYRNQSRNLNASLSIPYMIGGEWENMYPDFIFFQKTGTGKIVRTIVDPHGDWLGDSVAKLKGYIKYLRDYPEMFGSVLAVADEKNGECRYLDLMDPKVQDTIDQFTGSSAKDLFLGQLSRPYKLSVVQKQS
ncbi:DEAD/DEAH box helicase [Acidaminococcus fermentans]|uniref:DEAD/DEAH box helicase n=1 Tax=Acidaminococcus fermentans TaxID=905 RepID=UPI003F8B2519